jgi:hypothetical protein
MNSMRARIQAAGSGLILALAVGFVIAGPVAAEDRGHDERGRGGEARGHDERRGHERRDFRDRHRGDRGYGYDAPTYGGYAPPLVYAPPAPSPGIAWQHAPSSIFASSGIGD